MTITASHFRHKGTTYSVGHVIDIAPEYFDPTRMVTVAAAPVTIAMPSPPLVERRSHDTDVESTIPERPDLPPPSDDFVMPKRSRRKSLAE